MIVITNIKASTLSTDFVDISWELEDHTEDIDIYRFSIFRGGAEQGPWVIITPSEGLTDQYSFRDWRVNMLSKKRDYWYQLRTLNTSTNQEVISTAIRLAPPSDLIATEIIRKNNLLLQTLNGRRVYILKMRTFGSRCSCWDQKLGKTTRSTCLTCFNTGITSGYHRPIEAFVNIVENAENISNTVIGDVETEQIRAWVGTYPIFHPRDLIVTEENNRYRVRSPIMYNRRLGVIVSQMLPLSEIARSEIEYKIPIEITAYNRYPGNVVNYERMLDYYE